MPTQDPQARLQLEQVRPIVEASTFPRKGSAQDLSVGLEPEVFPLLLDDAGRPLGRFPLESSDPDCESVVSVFDRLAASEDWLEERDPEALAPRFSLANGGTITFEPGAQIEHSTAVHPTARAALEDISQLRERICGVFRAQGVGLAKCGLDLWQPVEEVSQQLRAPRYPAMAAYFSSRSSEGRVMMRHTATLQVNLDLGPEGVDVERWLVANLASPFICATFASSPRGEASCGRALAWQTLDPTRTGFPRQLIDAPPNTKLESWDPVEAIEDSALAADVLLFTDSTGEASPGTPGFSFERWLQAGHPEHGWPTAADLEYHLTTLFFEVRCRGFLELRACDALPEPWHVAPVVLLCGLLYDDIARGQALERLGPLRAMLPELWRRGARVGLSDERLAEHTLPLWRAALEGAGRLPAHYFRANDLATTERFLERFTAAGRTPSDELRSRLEQGAATAFAWAAGETPCLEHGGITA